MRDSVRSAQPSLAHLHHVLEPRQVHELLLVAQECHAGSQTHAEGHAGKNHRHQQGVVVLVTTRSKRAAAA